MDLKQLPENGQQIIDGVLAEFLPMCAIPHPSGRERAVVDYLAGRLAELGFSDIARDETENLLCRIPASPGCEDAPAVILQGHTDMVCAAAPDGGYRPETDGIVTRQEGGFLMTDGRSSLGADCGIGVACLMYLLAAGVPHGPVRLLLTSQEEVGLKGAAAVDAGWLSDSEYLINVDGFRLGDFICASAGGCRETFTRPAGRTAPAGDACLMLRMTGFTGGHSGYDIAKGRANPVRLLARLLRTVRSEMPDPIALELAAFSGGGGHNAIPMDACACVVLPECEKARFSALAESFGEMVEAQSCITDPNGRLTVEQADLPETVLDAASANALLDTLCNLYIGVYAMEDGDCTCPRSSANLGGAEEKDGVLEVRAFIRSGNRTEEELLLNRHEKAAAGFSRVCSGYPAWPGQPGDPLVRLMAGQYRSISGQSPAVRSVHVGLEPSRFYEKAPHLHMVNTGPTILDPHSVSERTDLSGLPCYVRMLAGTLAALAGQHRQALDAR